MTIEGLPKLGGTEANGRPVYSRSAVYIKRKKNSESAAVSAADNEFPETNLYVAVTTHLSYMILIFLGYIRDFMRRIGLMTNGNLAVTDDVFKMEKEYQNFYARHIYTRGQDVWNRPICSVPGPIMKVVDRYTEDHYITFKYPGTSTEVINLGSYNYLGFAETSGPFIDDVVKRIQDDGMSVCSFRKDVGTTALLKELEETTARFVGKDAAMVFGMGFATNSANIPALMGKHSLILSDSCNHTSLVLGTRLSGSVVRRFKHNDLKNLEKELRRAITEGQPRSHRPWKKILIIVEGIYSMEGTILNLPGLIALKKKYKAYLYVDEAHSIGCLGPTGRGVCDYYGIDSSEVDILMGTYTKSFGSAGGYIASSHEVINFLRQNSFGSTYALAMSPPVAQMILSTMRIIMGEDGTGDGKRRIKALAENTKYMRTKLKEMGFVLYGNDHSPVIPLLGYLPGRFIGLSRECLKRGLGVVVVGYPATPLVEGRCRLCISAALTREMIDKALTELDEIGDLLRLKYNKRCYAWL